MKDMRDMEKFLKEMRLPRLSHKEKEALWFEVQSRLNEPHPDFEETRAPIFTLLFGRFRLVAAAVAVAVLVSSTGATLAYADSSRPTDFLFSLDLAAENLRLAFASKEKKNELRIKFATERVNEVESLLKETIFPLIHAFATSTQTSGNGATSTAATSTSATSTAPTSTAPTSTILRGDYKLTIKSKSIQNSEKALSIALAQIENTRQRFELEGNTEASEALAAVISRLNTVAAQHIAALDEVKVSVNLQEKNGDIRAEIKISSDNLKSKFKITEKNDALKINVDTRDKGNENDDDDDEDDDDRGGKDGKKDKSDKGKDKKDKDDDDDRDEDENNDDDDKKSDTRAPRITNILHKVNGVSATISWRTNEKTRGTVWYATSTSVNATGTTPHASDADLDDEHKVSLTSLNASTTYYYVIQATDKSGNTATSSEERLTTKPDPDTHAPVISGLSASPTASTAQVSWNTNEFTTGKAYISTSTPATAGNAFAMIERVNASSSHHVTFTELSPSSTYRVFVTARDSAGNNATSSELAFTTAAPPDTAAPMISGLAATNVGSSTAAVSFTTNEPATSKLWLSTSTPVVISGAPHMSNALSVASHSFLLVGLNASSTYYYVASATDAASNTATSTQSSFTTSE